MNDLYKKLLKENNQNINYFTGEYGINLKKIVKEIRDYSIKSQSTEKVIENIIESFKENYDKNIRFYSFIKDINQFILEKKELCIENKEKQRFNIKEKIGIGIFVFVMIAFTIIGIVLKRPVKYDAPENIKIVDNIISYDGVEAATKYSIIIKDIHGNLVTQISTQYTQYNLNTVSSLQKGVTYYIYLQTEETSLMDRSEESEAIVYTKR